MKVKLNDDVLKQALVLHNQETMEQIPDIINTHNFSYRFEKKIRRINRAPEEVWRKHDNGKVYKILFKNCNFRFMFSC